MDVSFHKQKVADAFLLTFAMSGYLFTCLLSHGVTEERRAIRVVARVLQRLFAHPLLVGLGQTSIYAFATKTMFVYLLIALDAGRVEESAQIALMAGSLCLALGVAKIAPVLKRRAAAANRARPAA